MFFRKNQFSRSIRKCIVGVAVGGTLTICSTSHAQIFEANYIAISDGNIFVASYSNNSIAEYTLSGALVNASFITGLAAPTALAISGQDLFVVNNGTGTIGEYTTMGTTVNATLVSGLLNPNSIAVAGGNLFVTEEARGRIGEYSLSGATVNAALISGLADPTGIAVVAPVPECSTCVFVLLGLTLMLGANRFLIRKQADPSRA